MNSLGVLILLRGAKRLLGQAVSRKSAITPSILHAASDLLIFQFLYMRPCGLFFSLRSSLFLRKCNLVPDNPQQISPKVITRANLVFTPSGANIHVSASKTIQCHQRTLVLPIPSIPGSRVCPISALRRHLSLNPVASSTPHFTVLLGSGLEPITHKQFSGFLSRVASRLHLDPSRFSPHSCRRGGATFAFDCHIPSEIIKLQGDWHQRRLSCLFRIISAAETAWLSRYGSQVTVYVSSIILINPTSLLPQNLLAYFSILLNRPTPLSPPVWAFWRFWFIVQ